MSEENGPYDFDSAITDAEQACFAMLNEVMGFEPQVDSFISCRGRGAVDCMVFDIGGMQTGDVTTFVAKNYHWRATADFYNRDRGALQRAIMRLLRTLPIAPQYEADHPLLKDSNVVHFRIAPEQDGIGSILTKEIEPRNGAAKIPVFVCTVQFDVVFSVGDRNPAN